MKNSSVYIKSSVSDAVIIFIGTIGTIFSVMSAYKLTYDSSTILLLTAAASLIISFVYHAEKVVRWVGIGAFIIAVITGYLMFSFEIDGGFAHFLDVISNLFARLSIDIPKFSLLPYKFFYPINLYTAFFSFIAVILTFITAFAVIKIRSATLCLAFTVPFIAPALIFINKIPSISAFILYIAFILTVFMTGNIRIGKKNTSSAIAVIVPVLIFLFTIRTISPETTYVRADIGQKIYEFFSDKLPLQPETSDNPLPTVSGEITNHIAATIDLQNAQPPMGTGSVLNVKTKTPGLYYLRGISYDNYDNSQWKIRDNILNSGLQNEFYLINSSKKFILDAHTYATYSAITAEDDSHMTFGSKENAEVFEISTTLSGGSIAFMPYFSYYHSNYKYNIENDAYILKENKSSNYGFMTYSPQKAQAVLSSYVYKSTERNEENNFQYNYEKVIKEKYYDLPDDILGKLQDILRENSLITNGDDYKTITAIVEFVKNNAVYDINTPKTPGNKDYIMYFLTESKSGYCMHFASAATAMLRAAGYPARYVSGYVAVIPAGDYWTTVPERAAHAWVEIYFDGIGWVPFDPTPGIPGLTAPIWSETSEESPEESIAVSEPETSIPETSIEEPVNSEVSETEHGSSNDFVLIIKVVIIVLVVAFIVSIPFLRRLYIKNKRFKEFSSEQTNKAVIAAWQYLERFLPYGVSPSTEIYELALKAAFSNHTMSEDERKTVVEYAVNSAVTVEKSLSLFKKLIFRYIRCLN